MGTTILGLGVPLKGSVGVLGLGVPLKGSVGVTVRDL